MVKLVVNGMNEMNVFVLIIIIFLLLLLNMTIQPNYTLTGQYGI